jgi:hypothetical protein
VINSCNCLIILSNAIVYHFLWSPVWLDPLPPLPLISYKEKETVNKRTKTSNVQTYLMILKQRTKNMWQNWRAVKNLPDYRVHDGSYGLWCLHGCDLYLCLSYALDHDPVCNLVQFVCLRASYCCVLNTSDRKLVIKMQDNGNIPTMIRLAVCIFICARHFLKLFGIDQSLKWSKT